MPLVARPFARLLVALVSVFVLAAAQAPREALFGTWDGTYEPPGIVGGDPFSLLVDSVEGDAVGGVLVSATAPTRFTGTFNAERKTLVLTGEVDGDAISAELVLADGALVGEGRKGTWQWGFRLKRASAEVLERAHAPRVVELASTERPETFSLIGLDEEVGFRLDDLVHTFVTANVVVGVSIACVVDGELVDVRSSGWEDFFAGIPASDETRYRWASISKPMTASAAAKLASAGVLELDRDVRALVPEFPAKEVDGKPAVVTPREIMGHQSGIVHYEGALRTWRAYDSPQPFEDLANALDLFATSPLTFAPRTRESYSTHAWSLLGLTMQRAAKKPYAELVRELVLVPAGMKSTEPDFLSRAIPHRAAGYEELSDGTLFEVFGDDVSWKLPGGGWISTVGDLARFGAALIGTKMLSEEEKRLLWTPQTLADGTQQTNTGLGFEVGELGGERLICHSGGQRKASTFLAVFPERRLAVAVMSNTGQAPSGDLARAALTMLAKQVH